MKQALSFLLVAMSQLALAEDVAKLPISTDIWWCNDRSIFGDGCIQQFNVAADRTCHLIPDSNAKGDGKS